MQFRFTLSNNGTTQVINEPDGWQDIKIKLERDSNFHSLIEIIESNFFYYNANSSIDGGRQFITDVIASQGLNAIIQLLIEITEDEQQYDIVFTGNLDLSTISDSSKGDKFYKLQCSLTPSDLWSKFMNRKSTDIDINSSIDLDQNAVNLPHKIELQMVTQVVRKQFYADQLNPQGFLTRDLLTTYYIQFDLDEQIRKEFDNAYNIGFTYNSSLPVAEFEMVESGSYAFDLRFEASYYRRSLNQSIGAVTNSYQATSTYMDLYIQRNNDAAVLFTVTAESLGGNNSTLYTYSATQNLLQGDSIRVYGYIKLQPTNSVSESGSLIFYGKNKTITLEEIVLSGRFLDWNAATAYVTGDNVSISINASQESIYYHCINNNTNKPPATNPAFWTVTTCSGTFFITGARTVGDVNITLPSIPSGVNNPTYMSIVGDTITQNTESESILTLDVAQALLNRMTSSDFQIYSDYLGGISQGYSVNGCGHSFVLLKGLHVRGYTFAEKQFFLSFDGWWNGMNPIFNLGLGPEIINGMEVLRIEQKDHFYDDNPIIYFSNVNDIIRTYDKNVIFKSVEIGFSTWSAESATGIDDPQTKHTYSTPYKIIGQPLSLLSEFIAASLAIEQTRRNRKTFTTDWRLDNNTMIIALGGDDSSPGIMIETEDSGGPFSSITDLLNPESRYNIRLTPYHSFTRWIKYLSGCMQDYLTSNFVFNTAEGNYKMAVGANSDTCDTGTWAENQDITPTSNPYFTPQMYSFKAPLSWEDYKMIRDNRNRAVAVSQTDSDHKICHIQTLEYSIHHATVSITGWIK